MIDEKYIFFLNNLNDFERSVFLYCKILHFTQEETAKYLRKRKISITKTLKSINHDIDNKSLNHGDLEAFIFGN